MVVKVGRDRQRLILWSVVSAVLLASLLVIDLTSGAGIVTVILYSALLPTIAVGLVRWARKQERTLVRANGRLLLDGEPIEMARVELRVIKMPITKVPTGYSLSLWVMTATGPEDVPIGRSATLLEASMLSGQLEEFVQRANAKQHHRHA
ncbi:MAG TPA: hypothetical protein VGE37_11665 [Archangium sp.]|jgi:hypothetical protein